MSSLASSDAREFAARMRARQEELCSRAQASQRDNLGEPIADPELAEAARRMRVQTHLPQHSAAAIDIPTRILPDGSKVWLNERGQLHRTDGQAAFTAADPDEYSAWYVNGKLHRDNLPAELWVNKGTIKYWQNGVLHRGNDMPAIMYGYGGMMFYENGELHRDGQPAVIHRDGWLEYWVHNVLQRSVKCVDLTQVPPVEWVRNAPPAPTGQDPALEAERAANIADLDQNLRVPEHPDMGPPTMLLDGDARATTIVAMPAAPSGAPTAGNNNDDDDNDASDDE